MAEQQQQLLDAMPWYQSPVYRAAIVSIVMQVAVVFDLGEYVTGEEDAAAKVDAVLQIVALAAAVWAAWKRQRSHIQPLTLTRAAADAKPGTVHPGPPPADAEPKAGG